MIYRLIPQNYLCMTRWHPRRVDAGGECEAAQLQGEDGSALGRVDIKVTLFISHHWARSRLQWLFFFLRFREELETLSNSGINYVRIPVGYWTWQVEPEEPFPTPILDDSDSSGALFYLKRLLVWLDQLGMKANIDLHGAPGSQNGFEIRQKAKLPLDILGLITVGELARRTGWKKVRWIGPRRCWGWSAQRWDM